MSKSKKDVIIDIAESLGWSARFNIQTRWSNGKSEKYVEFSQYSPAGQDFGFSVFYDNLSDIPQKVYEVYENYDIEEEVELWLAAKRNGVSGVPDVVTLVEDQKEIEKMLDELWSELAASKQLRRK